MKTNEEKTQLLFNWYIDAKNDRLQIFKKRLYILEQNYSEDIENKLLELNSQMYKDITKLMDYCRANIVSYHLTLEQRNILHSDTKTDSTHTALRYS